MLLPILAASLAVAATPDCRPVAGTDLLLRDDVRFVAIGELHGAAETPAAFGEIACRAAQDGPVLVVLEFPAAMQSTLDAAMAAPDETAARALILNYPTGPFRFHDGRGSEAMMALLMRLRMLTAAGLPIRVMAGVPESPRVEGFTQSHTELDRAALWSRAARAEPERRVLILVGSVHAEKARRQRGGLGLPALAHFRPEETLSLRVAQQGGAAWNCVEDCGPHQPEPVDPPDLRGVILAPEPDGSFDGMLALGPTTASPPAPR